MSTTTPGRKDANRFIRLTKSWLTVLILIAFILMAQRASLLVYDIGMLVVIAAVLLGLTFNNLPAGTSYFGIIKGLIITWVIVGCVVGLSIMLAPLLVSLGR